MAFLQNYRGTRWRIRFRMDGKQQAIYLPANTTKRDRQTFRDRIESLLAVHDLQSTPAPSLLAWCNSLPESMLLKLAKSGLIEYEQDVSLTVNALCDRYYETRQSSVSESTQRNWRKTQRKLVEFFPDNDIKDLTKGDTKGFKDYLLGNNNAKSSVSGYISTARLMFAFAVDHELLEVNPFDGIKAGKRINRDRSRFIDLPTINTILEALPTTATRTAVALARFAGLRCPTEILDLRWENVDWENSRIRIVTHKTQARVVPLFPELRTYIDAAWDADEDADYVVSNRNRYSLSWHLKSTIRKCGFDQWPRLWHNLRASRQTELTNDYPDHVVCSWLGNSKSIAKDHYLQTNNEHFDRATRAPLSAPLPDATRTTDEGNPLPETPNL